MFFLQFCDKLGEVEDLHMVHLLNDCKNLSNKDARAGPNQNPYSTNATINMKPNRIKEHVISIFPLRRAF